MLNLRSAVSIRLLVSVVMIQVLAGCEQSSPDPTDPASDASASKTTNESTASAEDIAAMRDLAASEGQGASSGDPSAAQQSAQASPGLAPPSAASNVPHAAQGRAALALQFEAPSSWVAEQPASSMRAAQYRLPRAPGDAADGELVLFYFGPGSGGGVDANLQRWRSQFQGPNGQALPASAGSTEVITSSAGLKVTVLEVQGTYAPPAMGPRVPAREPAPGFALLGAVVESPKGPWFFKATGPSATIKSQRDAFREMLLAVSEH